MTTTRLIVLTGALGVMVSIMLLAFLHRGGTGILILSDDVDLFFILWPAAVELRVHWASTLSNLILTAFLIALNGATYSAVGLGIRQLFRLIRRSSDKK